MRHVIGFWSPSSKEKSWDRSIDESSHYILDKSANAEEGEYVFDVINSIVNKKGETLYFITPHTLIVKGSRSWTGKYAYSELHRIMKRLFLLYEEPREENLYDRYETNYAMRILRSIGFDWVPEEHTKESRSQFISTIHDKILNGELNMNQLYLDTIKEVEYMNYDTDELTPFDKKLAFDPKYDRLIPEFIPNSESGCVEFISSDISSHMHHVVIYDESNYEKYKNYLHPDVELKIRSVIKNGRSTDIFSVGYKLPDRNSDAYKKMIRGISISEIYLGSTWSRNDIQISVPSTQDPNQDHAMYVSEFFYPEVFKDILDEFHMRFDSRFASPTDRYLTCDEDYRIMDVYEHGVLQTTPHSMIHIKFANGGIGFFPAIDVISKLKGKCLNAVISKKGDRLENLTIEIKRL